MLVVTQNFILIMYAYFFVHMKLLRDQHKFVLLIFMIILTYLVLAQQISYTTWVII